MDNEQRRNREIMDEMHAIQTRAFFRAFTISFLEDSGAPMEIIDTFTKQHNRLLAEAVAKLTGGNADDISDKNKRTPEQYRLMLEVSAIDQKSRLDAFLSSNYSRALDVLTNRYMSETGATIKTLSESDHLSIQQIALYYFATNKQINPDTAFNLSDTEKAVLCKPLEKALKLQKDSPLLSFSQATDEVLGLTFREKTQLLSVIPQKHVIPNNKLSNELTRDIIGAGTIDLIVGNRGKKNEMTAICVLTYEGDNVKITGRQPFTEYDRNVLNAAVSLYIYGNTDKIFTPAMVYRAMVNMTETETPSKEQIEAVTNSLDKMRFIRVRVDCTEELKRRGASIDGEQISSGKIDTYLLMMESVEVTAGGKTMSAYQVMRAPILYEYSNLIGQVLTVPAGLLDIKVNGQRVRNTEQRIAIKGYLMRRIEGMKGKNALKNDTISFESYEKDGEHRAGIYERADAENASRAVKQRIRDYAENVLQYWIDEKYIAGYELIKGDGSAQSIKSIRIILK